MAAFAKVSATTDVAERLAEQQLSTQGYAIAATLAACDECFESMGHVQHYLLAKGFTDDFALTGLSALFEAEDDGTSDEEPHIRLCRIVSALACDDDTVDIPLTRVGDHLHGTFDASPAPNQERCAVTSAAPFDPYFAGAVESFSIDVGDDDGEWCVEPGLFNATPPNAISREPAWHHRLRTKRASARRLLNTVNLRRINHGRLLSAVKLLEDHHGSAVPRRVLTHLGSLRTSASSYHDPA